MLHLWSNCNLQLRVRVFSICLMHKHKRQGLVMPSGDQETGTTRRMPTSFDAQSANAVWRHAPARNEIVSTASTSAAYTCARVSLILVSFWMVCTWKLLQKYSEGKSGYNRKAWYRRANRTKSLIKFGLLQLPADDQRVLEVVGC